MAKFLVLYRAPMSAREQMASATPEQAKAGMDAWMAWAGKAGGAIVDLGAPLGDRKAVGAGKTDNEIAGFSILESGSEADVVKLLEDHPHFQTPGGSIEVHEFLSMPGM
jgi:hypothetical protein